MQLLHHIEETTKRDYILNKNTEKNNLSHMEQASKKVPNSLTTLFCSF